MSVDDLIHNALRSHQSTSSLRILVDDLAREGYSKPAIVKLLEDFVVRQRTQVDFRETDEDSVFDVLDSLGGWCHPTAELLPEPALPAEIRKWSTEAHPTPADSSKPTVS